MNSYDSKIDLLRIKLNRRLEDFRRQLNKIEFDILASTGIDVRISHACHDRQAITITCNLPDFSITIENNYIIIDKKYIDIYELPILNKLLSYFENADRIKKLGKTLINVQNCNYNYIKKQNKFFDDELKYITGYRKTLSRAIERNIIPSIDYTAFNEADNMSRALYNSPLWQGSYIKTVQHQVLLDTNNIHYYPLANEIMALSNKEYYELNNLNII